MPFLFVDYDQGAGGERFCAALSQAPQCETLEYLVYPNGRTKVLDCFNQEFLMPQPKIDPKTSHKDLYTVVPTHRHSNLAQQHLLDVRTIRIAWPKNQILRDHVVQQRIKKVLLSSEPNQEYFVGYLKILQKSALDQNFLKKVKFGMNNAELFLLSQGIDPTPDQVEQYIQSCNQHFHDEPDFDYDLVIEYELLVDSIDTVCSKIYQTFGIDLDSSKLQYYAPANYSAT